MGGESSSLCITYWLEIYPDMNLEILSWKNHGKSENPVP